MYTFITETWAVGLLVILEGLKASPISMNVTVDKWQEIGLKVPKKTMASIHPKKKIKRQLYGR